MNYIKLLQEAQENSRVVATKLVRCYKTSFTPPKKASRPKECSANVQKLIAEMNDKIKRKTLKIPNVNKTVRQIEREAIKCDTDSRYGVDEDDYVSKEASEFYGQLMAKYNKMPNDSGFLPHKRKQKIHSNKRGTDSRAPRDQANKPQQQITPKPGKSSLLEVDKRPPRSRSELGKPNILKITPGHSKKLEKRSQTKEHLNNKVVIQVLRQKRPMEERQGLLQKTQSRSGGSFRVKKKIKKRVIISDSEDDGKDELDNFICENDVDYGIDVSKHIKEIFGYDRSKFSGINEELCEESSFARQMQEERISGKLGLIEEIEDIDNEIKMKLKKRRLQGNAGGGLIL